MGQSPIDPGKGNFLKEVPLRTPLKNFQMGIYLIFEEGISLFEKS
jgi:hypothetical protein